MRLINGKSHLRILINLFINWNVSFRLGANLLELESKEFTLTIPPW